MCAAIVRNKNVGRKPIPEPKTVDLSWMDKARCKDMSAEIFYPSEDLTPAQVKKRLDHAKSICEECPVITPCLRRAVEDMERGVWGGTTENEREKIRREAKQERFAPEVLRGKRQKLLDESKGTDREALVKLAVLVADLADECDEGND